MDHEKHLQDVEAALIQSLRKEAFDVKDCFTRYTFQGLALATGLQGIGLKLQEHDPFVGLAGLPLAIFLLTIMSIGTHKYATAHRLLGYQLHIERVRRYPTAGAPGWAGRMRNVGWEEALRAWRIVQPTVFEYLFVHGDLSPERTWKQRAKRAMRPYLEILLFWRVDQLRSQFIDRNGNQQSPTSDRWFETRSHLKPGMEYYHGGYLKTLLSMLSVSTLVCLVFLASTPIRLALADKKQYAIVTAILAILFAYYALGRLYRVRSRRWLIEESFLSINSCAVLWQVTIAAHFMALARLGYGNNGRFTSYKDYSRTLGDVAVSFAHDVFRLYEWHAQSTRDLSGQSP